MSLLEHKRPHNLIIFIFYKINLLYNRSFSIHMFYFTHSEKHFCDPELTPIFSFQRRSLNFTIHIVNSCISSNHPENQIENRKCLCELIATQFIISNIPLLPHRWMTWLSHRNLHHATLWASRMTFETHSSLHPQPNLKFILFSIEKGNVTWM